MFTYDEAVAVWGRHHLQAMVERGIFRRVLRGVYAEADDDDPWLVHRAALRLAPAGSALAERSAAALLASMVDIPAVPELVTPRRTVISGVHTRVGLTYDQDLTQRLGMAATCGDLTGADCARLLPRVEAVVVLDRLLRAGQASQLAIATVLDRAPGCRGVARARIRLAESEARSDSPGETRLRLVLVDGGLPRPEVQVRVTTSDGGFLALLDLGWQEARGGFEYDGAVHLTSRQAGRDRSRRRAIAAHSDWEVHEVGAAEMRQPHHIVEDALDMLRRRCPRLMTSG